MKPKELRSLLRAVSATDGWLVVGTNNHVKVVGPDGRKIFTSMTARSPRVVANVLADLKRIGWRAQTRPSAPTGAGASGRNDQPAKP